MTESAIFFSARPRAHGSEHQRMSCHFRAWLVLAVLLLPGALTAQVPAIADIPDDLPAKLRLPLAQTRASLVVRRDQLKGRVSEQYDKCSAVPEGSPQEQLCRVSKAELQTAIGEYAADVRKFNADVAVANCAQRANAEAVYSDLKQRIQTDQQIIHNFGFEQRADEIQAWADLGEQARESYEKKARVILIDVTLAGVVAGLQDGVSAAPPFLKN